MREMVDGLPDSIVNIWDVLYINSEINFPSRTSWPQPNIMLIDVLSSILRICIQSQHAMRSNYYQLVSRVHVSSSDEIVMGSGAFEAQSRMSLMLSRDGPLQTSLNLVAW